MTNLHRCGCDLGGDCTKTTMCKVQSAVEDCLERIEELETDADSLRNTITSCQLTIKELQAENARLRQEMGDG